MKMKIPILLYHSVDTDVSSGFETWAIAPNKFDDHMKYIVENSYTPLTVSQLISCLQTESIPHKPIVITFDDGFLDFYENAMPILTRYDLPSTLYITTGYIGGTSQWLWREGEGKRPMMSWAQVQEIDKNGVECGAHTLTHPQLDVVSRQQARREIIDSKKALEDCLGKNTASFAYPHGHYDAIVRGVVKEAGYTSACGVKHALSSTQDDRFSLARIIIKAQTSVEELASLIEDDILTVAPISERPRTKVWRLVRQVKHTFGL